MNGGKAITLPHITAPAILKGPHSAHESRQIAALKLTVPPYIFIIDVLDSELGCLFQKGLSIKGVEFNLITYLGPPPEPAPPKVFIFYSYICKPELLLISLLTLAIAHCIKNI
jgi:hypothetical protein